MDFIISYLDLKCNLSKIQLSTIYYCNPARSLFNSKYNSITRVLWFLNIGLISTIVCLLCVKKTPWSTANKLEI